MSAAANCPDKLGAGINLTPTDTLKVGLLCVGKPLADFLDPAINHDTRDMPLDKPSSVSSGTTAQWAVNRHPVVIHYQRP